MAFFDGLKIPQGDVARIDVNDKEIWHNTHILLDGYEPAMYTSFYANDSDKVDTGIILDDKTIVKCTFKLRSAASTSTYGIVFGARQTTASRAFSFDFNSGKWRCSYGNVSATTTGTPDTNKHTIVVDGGKFYLDDELIADKSEQTAFTTPSTCYIGAINTPTTKYYGNVDIFDLQIIKSNKTLAHYIPAYGNDTSVLYNAINNQALIP